ncbi:MAG: hypothetical protein WAM81_06440 [Acidimicrobiia bacterium]
MPMSDEHKAALAQGRRESRAIKGYLEALGRRKPGRPVTRESLERKLAGLNAKISKEGDLLKRVDLVQRRLEGEEALASMEHAANLGELETAFAEVAKGYSDRKGISYSAWREIGVAADVLRRAGIPQTRRRV